MPTPTWDAGGLAWWHPAEPHLGTIWPCARELAITGLPGEAWATLRHPPEPPRAPLHLRAMPRFILTHMQDKNVGTTAA
ncbi:UNVERIFIED_CONTAM: hypothetical protein K2H54_053757 [Gekko kuhli]